MGKRQDKLNDYEGFVNKFKPKKTTDDCYTPPEVYEAVKGWVFRECGLPDGTPIVRPFYPGGDYERAEYPDGCIVLDNPPFSILSVIYRFYVGHGIPFFLFAPSQQLFKSIEGLTYIISGNKVVYENGAAVRTSFVTNLPAFAEYRVIGAPDLGAMVEDAQKKAQEAVKVMLPVYSYPDHLVTSCSISYLVEKGIGIRIPRDETEFIRALDAQAPLKKSIYGSGFLVSDRQAEKLKAEKLKAAYRFELSVSEREIVRKLSE